MLAARTPVLPFPQRSDRSRSAITHAPAVDRCIAINRCHSPLSSTLHTRGASVEVAPARWRAAIAHRRIASETSPSWSAHAPPSPRPSPQPSQPWPSAPLPSRMPHSPAAPQHAGVSSVQLSAACPQSGAVARHPPSREAVASLLLATRHGSRVCESRATQPGCVSQLSCAAARARASSAQPGRTAQPEHCALAAGAQHPFPGNPAMQPGCGLPPCASVGCASQTHLGVSSPVPAASQRPPPPARPAALAPLAVCERERSRPPQLLQLLPRHAV